REGRRRPCGWGRRLGCRRPRRPRRSGGGAKWQQPTTRRLWRKPAPVVPPDPPQSRRGDASAAKGTESRIAAPGGSDAGQLLGLVEEALDLVAQPQAQLVDGAP